MMDKKTMTLLGAGAAVAAIAVIIGITMMGSDEKVAPQPSPLPVATPPVSPVTAVKAPQSQVQTPAVAPVAPAAAPQPMAALPPVAPASPVNAVQPVASQEPTEPSMQDELKRLLDTQFKDALSFPFDETMMINFVKTAEAVKRINNKWDVQVASADSDAIAIEYSNMAVEEITVAFKKNLKLNLEQYNELMMLTTSNPEFNQLYQAYKSLWKEGSIATPEKQVPAPAALEMPIMSSDAPVIGTSPAQVPVNPGTMPATPGSSTPQYSQPVSR